VYVVVRVVLYAELNGIKTGQSKHFLLRQVFGISNVKDNFLNINLLLNTKLFSIFFLFIIRILIYIIV